MIFQPTKWIMKIINANDFTLSPLKAFAAREEKESFSRGEELNGIKRRRLLLAFFSEWEKE